MDDLIVDFLAETNESLEELDRDLVTFEQNPNDKGLLGNIFRLVHTIKGTCGFLNLPRLEKVTHHAENVLERFRDGDLEVTPEYVTLIFESIDQIKYIVNEIEKSHTEPDGDDQELIARLDAVFEVATIGGRSEPEEDTYIEKSDPAFTAEPEMVVISHCTESAPENKLDEPAPKKTPQTLRVNVDVLENLMNMISELVLTRNQLSQILRSEEETPFRGPLHRLNHVVSDLQDGVMKTRMQPIGNALSKLPRIIRDLEIELDKKIDFQIIGQETELDRQVLEMIRDPLTHMVRNSGDHGIEKPDDRIAAGKPETGKIILEAFHEGGHIIIKISDDGQGLDQDKIVAKILSNGLATREELNEMSEPQIQQFIFKAGFSTAKTITAVSGRGVGMDVVRTNIEKIGGSIELTSSEGKGASFTIKIPLTLAIITALIVESAGERFAIPQLAVRELVMLSDHGDARVECIKGASFFRLRDRLLPLVSLSHVLGLTDDTHHPDISQGLPELAERKNCYLVVARVGGYEFGIIVDRVFDTEEIVVKPVASVLKDLQLFSGNTILGDGQVIMILDPNGMANVSGRMENADIQNAQVSSTADSPDMHKKTSLLLFRVGDQAPKAVPISLIARLENVKTSNIEYSSGQMMVPYREDLMPLIPFNTTVQIPDDGDKPVLVFADTTQSMGIIVDEIIDIMEEYIDIQLSSKEDDLLGKAIINGQATDVVNIGVFLNKVNKDWFKDHDDTSLDARADVELAGQVKKKLLLVDDSPFFRNMLAPFLSVAGYDVTSIDGPTDALQMREDGATFDVIVSDLEMPDMSGFEFAEKVKTPDSKWFKTPMIALSSHATPQDIERGTKVGFSNYVAKFDKYTLLQALSKMV